MTRPGAEADDAEVLARIQGGSGQAFRELVDRHGRYLYGIARTLVQDPFDAEDVVQETFAALVGGNFRGESSLRTWMVGILVKQAALFRRRRKRWPKPAEIEDGPGKGGTQSAVDARLDLAEMLDKLSHEHKEVIVLRELQGMTYDEMSELLNVPRGTIESRLHRAREQLKQLFGAK